MKKSYLILAAVAGLFASCAQNEDIVQITDEPVAIGFNSEFVDNVTRAEMDMTWFKTTNNAFGVYGFKGAAGESGTVNLFTNEEVKWNGSDWAHTTVRFWDKAANNYNFYAYAPRNAYSVAWDNTKGFTFSAIPTIVKITDSTVEDVVVAIAQENYSYSNCETDHASVEAGHPTHAHNGFVPFTFQHVLSKLSFQVKTHEDYSSTATFTIKKIELNFPTGTATWSETAKNAVAGTTTYPTYTAAETTGTITYETSVYDNTTGQAATSTVAEIGDKFIVTPVNTTDVTGHAFGVKVTYDVAYSDVTEMGCIATGSIDAAAYNPKQNEAWVITIDINPAKIDFCVDKVEAWDPKVLNAVEVN